MNMRSWCGKFFQHATTAAVLAVVLAMTSGCNFFGKQVDDEVVRAPGQLADGVSMVGTWTMSGTNTSETYNPTYAVTTSYIFDPNGTMRIEIRDMHSAGISCVAYGQYRNLGDREVVIYLQNSTGVCGFSAQMRFSNVQVTGDLMQVLDLTGGAPGSNYVYFKSHPQEAAPVGLWNFGGSGGVDFILFDAHGYFILQTTDQAGPFLMLGAYSVGSGADIGKLSLRFFSKMDPASSAGNPLVFSQYVTDGRDLQLVETNINDPEKPFVYTGHRL